MYKVRIPVVRRRNSTIAEAARSGSRRRGTWVGAIETVGIHVARLFPNADATTLHQLEAASQARPFGRRDALHSRPIHARPSVVLDGHIMARRVAETGQVHAALIAGAGY